MLKCQTTSLEMNCGLVYTNSSMLAAYSRALLVLEFDQAVQGLHFLTDWSYITTITTL